MNFFKISIQKKDLLKLKQYMKSCHNSLQLFKSKNLFLKFKAKKN